jgi:LacI family transcriptional regulator
MTKKSHSVTIRQVAQKAGVSVATVSRYINRNAPISKDVSERLKVVMAELRYVPHAAARHLASRKTRVIGLLLNNMYNDFFAPLLSGIESVVREHKYNLLVATNHTDNAADVLPPLGSHNTDGLLVFADSLTDTDLISLYKSEFPVVLIHRSSPPSVNIPSITVENKAATYKLMEHIIHEHNKRRIILMRGPAHQEDAYWRETGYKAALEANGIPFDESLVLSGQFERDVAYKSLNTFLGNGKRVAFDSVFAGDDDAAVGVIASLTEHGYRVPQDIAVVGFDDVKISNFLTPPLTTVSAPTESVGRIAAEQLFSLFDKQFLEDITLLPTELIIRRSCGCNT